MNQNSNYNEDKKTKALSESEENEVLQKAKDFYYDSDDDPIVQKKGEEIQEILDLSIVDAKVQKELFWPEEGGPNIEMELRTKTIDLLTKGGMSTDPGRPLESWTTLELLDFYMYPAANDPEYKGNVAKRNAYIVSRSAEIAYDTGMSQRRLVRWMNRYHGVREGIVLGHTSKLIGIHINQLSIPPFFENVENSKVDMVRQKILNVVGAEKIKGFLEKNIFSKVSKSLQKKVDEEMEKEWGDFEGERSGQINDVKNKFSEYRRNMELSLANDPYADEIRRDLFVRGVAGNPFTDGDIEALEVALGKGHRSLAPLSNAFAEFDGMQFSEAKTAKFRSLKLGDAVDSMSLKEKQTGNVELIVKEAEGRSEFNRFDEIESNMTTFYQYLQEYELHNHSNLAMNADSLRVLARDLQSIGWPTSTVPDQVLSPAHTTQLLERVRRYIALQKLKKLVKRKTISYKEANELKKTIRLLEEDDMNSVNMKRTFRVIKLLEGEQREVKKTWDEKKKTMEALLLRQAQLEKEKEINPEAGEKLKGLEEEITQLKKEIKDLSEKKYNLELWIRDIANSKITLDNLPRIEQEMLNNQDLDGLVTEDDLKNIRLNVEKEVGKTVLNMIDNHSTKMLNDEAGKKNEIERIGYDAVSTCLECIRIICEKSCHKLFHTDA